MACDDSPNSTSVPISIAICLAVRAVGHGAPRCVGTTSGSWVCQEIPHSAIASDMASGLGQPAAVSELGQGGGTGMRHEGSCRRV